jgi:ADP-ribose pyrophosphatase
MLTRSRPLNLQEIGSAQSDSLVDPRSPLASQFLFYSPLLPSSVSQRFCFLADEDFILFDMPAKRKKSSSMVRVISSKTTFRGPVFSVMTDEVEEPGNVRARRDVIRHSGSIVILPLDNSGRTPMVLLERQYRYAAGRRMWELPAGRVDPGENDLAAAKRELIEETGYTASRWQKALFFYVSPGFLDESMTVYLASGLKKGVAQPEEDERIAVRFFPLRQAVQMATTGKIIDAKTIASLFWLEKKLAKIK